MSTGVSLFVHEQVRVVDLLELNFDWFGEDGTDVVGGLRGHRHGLRDRWIAKVNHDGVGITIDNIGAVLIAISYLRE